MKFPAWSDFTEKVSQLEEKIQSNVGSFHEKHPVLERVLTESFSLLPTPFNDIAEKIYNAASGSEEERSEAVIKYLQKIIDQGQEQYSKVTLQLENILSQVEDIKTITAKESTLSKVQQILITTGEETNQGLNSLNQEIVSLGIKVDTVVDSTAKLIRRSDYILSILEGKEYKAHIDQTGNTIHFKVQDTTIGTITANELDRLDSGSRQLIRAYEQSMRINFNIFTAVYPQIAAADSVAQEKLKAQLRPIIDQMCKDLGNIFGYINSLGKQLHDHYMNIQFACDKAKKDLAPVDTFT